VTTKSSTTQFQLSGSTVPKQYTIAGPISILDQGSLGSCVSNAFALCLYLVTNNTLSLSRLYLYFNGRAVSGSPLQEDTGLSVRDGAKSISTYGICQESVYPYDITNYDMLPSFTTYKKANLLPNFSYYFINNNIIPSVKNILVTTKTPIIFGLQVYSSFMSASVAESGIVPLPKVDKETLEGGHCMCIIGYNDKTQTMTCVNSWGSNWGSKGLCFIPYAYISDPTLCSDFCVIRLTNPTPQNSISNKQIYAKALDSMASKLTSTPPNKKINTKLAFLY
jgi:C1A family cysteine protease